MKQIFNWTLGSFFRSIGRICAYLLIGFLIFYVGSKLGLFSLLKLEAATIHDKLMTIDYDSELIGRNHKAQFFGENGHLERVRKQLELDLPYGNYAIFFTRDNICVERYGGYDFSAVSYGLGTSRTDYYAASLNYFFNNGKFYITSLVSDNSKKLCLKQFNDIDSYLNALTNFDNTASVMSQTSVIDSVSVTLDKLSSSFDLYDLGFTDYYVLYSSSSPNSSFRNVLAENIFAWKYFNQKSDFPDYTSISHYYSSSKTSYYGTKGYVEPSVPYGGYVKNTALIIDSKNLNNAYTSFEFKSDIQPVIDKIEFYVVVNDNGLKHYEKLDSSVVTNFNYVSTYKNKLFKFSFNSNAFTTTSDLSNYESVYVKINYSNAFQVHKNSLKYTLGPYTNQVINNDVCSECLFLQLESSGRNTYLFSNSDSSKETAFYYTDVIKNEFLYNEPSFINLTDKTTLVTDIKVRKLKSYYATFNKILFDSYQVGGNTGLIMSLYFLGTYDLANGTILNHNGTAWSGSFQILYFLTPNIYWSDSVYSLVRDSFTGKSINENGEVEEITIKGDFINHDYESKLFDNKLNFLTSILSEDIYGLSGVLLTPLTFIKSLTSKTCETFELPIPFTNKVINVPCLSDFYNTYAPELLLIWRIVLNGIVAYGIIFDMFRSIVSVIDVDKNELEVVDL